MPRGLVYVAAAREDFERAAELAERALVHAGRAGDSFLVKDLVHNLALERHAELGDRAGEALALYGLGHWKTGAGMVFERHERERLDATLAALSLQLSPEELKELLNEGRRMTADEAVALALGSDA